LEPDERVECKTAPPERQALRSQNFSHPFFQFLPALGRLATYRFVIQNFGSASAIVLAKIQPTGLGQIPSEIVLNTYKGIPYGLFIQPQP
jgi:hypothetical protein